MIRWTLSLTLPFLAVYLLTEHPALTQASFWGFTSREILLVHGGQLALVGILSVLFARSRAFMVATLSFCFSLALPILASLDFDPQVASLAFLAAGLCLVAAPEKRVWRSTSLIWLGLSAVFALGLFTVGEMYGRSSVNHLILGAVAVWGAITVGLRDRTDSGACESLMMSSLVATAFCGWTFSLGGQSLSATGFQVTCFLACLPNLASVVEHSFRLAYIDQLTEIPGRRALVEAMDDPDRVFTLAMLDVDHFKKFNDTHGHEVGDHVLRMVAARLSTVGVGGTAYRYGGEEFTVVFPGKTAEEVEPELERLRELVEQSPLVLRGADRPKEKPKKPKKAKKSRKKKPSVNVTISIGAATRHSNEHWERVMKRADDALYQAKESGRNRVCRAS